MQSGFSKPPTRYARHRGTRVRKYAGHWTVAAPRPEDARPCGTRQNVASVSRERKSQDQSRRKLPTTDGRIAAGGVPEATASGKPPAAFVALSRDRPRERPMPQMSYAQALTAAKQM